MDNAWKGEETSNYELEFGTKSNEIRYLLLNETTCRDEDSNIIGVVGVAQDVTEAAHCDRAVTGMANELCQLVDNANAPIFGIDVCGHVNELNNMTATITGFSKEGALGKQPVSTFIVPKLQNAFKQVVTNSLKELRHRNTSLSSVQSLVKSVIYW